MRKIINICGLFILFAIATYAQNITMTIADVEVTTGGEKVTVPINVANFNNVAGVTLVIQYDPTIATFDSSSRPAEFLLNEPTEGEIRIGRAMLTAVTPANGKLLNLYFTYIDGSGVITFNTAQCELANTSGQVITGVIYNNGGIVNPSQATTVELESVVASGSTVAVGLSVTNFENVGAVTWKIQYNPAVAEFDTISGPAGFLANAVDGEISIVRAALEPITPTSGKLLDLNFNYIGGGTNLTFDVEQCEVANSLGEVISGVQYIDGRIAQEEILVELADVEVAIGEKIAVPLTVTDFDNVGAVTWKIQYDPFVATFDSISGSDDFLANAGSGEISIVRAGLTAVTPTQGKLLDVYFTIIGPLGSDADLIFNVAECEVADINGEVIFGVVYEDGSINITTDVEIDKPGIPSDYSLNQNFPNPFNPSTTIKFSIPEYSLVVLKVYNLLGQEVATLVNKDLLAGNYQYKFDATNLTSGAYIYKITAGDFVSTKKMLFIK